EGAPARAPDASRDGLGAEAAGAGRAGGPQVTGDAAAAAPSPVAERAAYRVVQEALTNAAKHAPAAPVTVSVAYAATAAEVRVENGAPPPPGGAKGTA
ncbi:sensor histidine kinase, partial [Streptomyces sp. HSW2009]